MPSRRAAWDKLPHGNLHGLADGKLRQVVQIVGRRQSWRRGQHANFFISKSHYATWRHTQLIVM